MPKDIIFNKIDQSVFFNKEPYFLKWDNVVVIYTKCSPFVNQIFTNVNSSTPKLLVNIFNILISSIAVGCDLICYFRNKFKRRLIVVVIDTGYESCILVPYEPRQFLKFTIHRSSYIGIHYSTSKLMCMVKLYEISTTLKLHFIQQFHLRKHFQLEIEIEHLIDELL